MRVLRVIDDIYLYMYTCVYTHTLCEIFDLCVHTHNYLQLLPYKNDAHVSLDSDLIDDHSVVCSHDPVF